MENKDNNKPQKPRSFLDTVREIDAADRKAELEEEAKLAEERAKREQAQRRSYEEKLRQERLELMKLKQGMIEETDIKSEPVVERTYTFSEKVSNFIYHYKPFLIVGTLLTALAIFLIYDFATKERPDLQSMYIAADYDMSYYCQEITPLWSQYCGDYNKNGESLARLYYIPADYEDDSAASLYFAQADRTKLIGEFQSGNTVMVIGDKKAYQAIGVLEDVFVDCRELFPDDPYAEELGYRLAGTDFTEILGMENFDDSQLYVSFRKPVRTMAMKEEKMQIKYDQAVEFWTNFLSEHRVDGAVLEPTIDPEPLPPTEYDIFAEEQEAKQNQ